MTTLTEQERNAVTTACKYALQDYLRAQSLPVLNLMSKEIKLLESALDKLSTAPKYNPYRLFKEGDIVEPRSVNGRFDAKLSGCYRYVVLTDEKNSLSSYVLVKPLTRDNEISTNAIFLKLVTPVEEREQYSVHESEVANSFDIMRENMCVMTFPYGSKEAGYYRNKLAAKEAAQAERDRLNAEYRKEMEK